MPGTLHVGIAVGEHVPTSKKQDGQTSEIGGATISGIHPVLQLPKPLLLGLHLLQQTRRHLAQEGGVFQQVAASISIALLGLARSARSSSMPRLTQSFISSRNRLYSATSSRIRSTCSGRRKRVLLLPCQVKLNW
jgi:hypothetical protein